MCLKEIFNHIASTEERCLPDIHPAGLFILFASGPNGLQPLEPFGPLKDQHPFGRSSFFSYPKLYSS